MPRQASSQNIFVSINGAIMVDYYQCDLCLTKGRYVPADHCLVCGVNRVCEKCRHVHDCLEVFSEQESMVVLKATKNVST